MVGNVTIQGQIVGTATFDGAKISAVVTIAPPINATVVFGRSGVTVHNLLNGRDAEDVHPIEAISAPVNDNSNIYGWIRRALLTGIETFTDVAITVEDTILSAFAKLQGQINAVKSRVGLLEGFGVNSGANLATTNDSITISSTAATYTQQTWAANLLHASPLLPCVSFKCLSAAIEVTTAIAGAKAKIIIWSTRNGVAYTKLYEGIELDLSKVGDIVDSSIDFNFDKLSIYYIGLHSSSAVSLRAEPVAATRVIKNDGSPGLGSNKNYMSATLAYGSAIPSVFPAFTFGFTNIPIIRFKISQLL